MPQKKKRPIKPSEMFPPDKTSVTDPNVRARVEGQKFGHSLRQEERAGIGLPFAGPFDEDNSAFAGFVVNAKEKHAARKKSHTDSLRANLEKLKGTANLKRKRR